MKTVIPALLFALMIIGALASCALGQQPQTKVTGGHPVETTPPTLSIATNTALGTLEQQKRQLRQQISQIEQQIQQVQQQEVAVEGEFNRDHAGFHINPMSFEVERDQKPPAAPARSTPEDKKEKR